MFSMLFAVLVVVPVAPDHLSLAADCIPAIPSPSQPPGANNPGEECLPTGPELYYQPARTLVGQDADIPPPVPEGHTGKFAVAEFSVPVRADAGYVQYRAFISRRTVNIPLPDVPRTPFSDPPSVDLFGNDRDFSSAASTDVTKLSIIMDFRTGRAVAVESPTCADINVPNFPDRTYCHDALPLDDTSSGSRFQIATASAGENGWQNDVVGIRFASKISVLESVPVLRLTPPPIDGDLTFTLQSDGNVCLAGTTDAFPSIESYQFRDGVEPRTILQDAEAEQPLPALAGLNRRHLSTCDS